MYWAGWQTEIQQPKLSKLIRKAAVSEMCRLCFDKYQSQSLIAEYQGKGIPQINWMARLKNVELCKNLSIDQILRIKSRQKIERQSLQQQHTNPELHSILRCKLDEQGIKSDQTRRRLWLEFSGYYALGDTYEVLKKLQFSSYFQRMIQEDIKRTPCSQAHSKAAFNVLSAFSKYNSNLGYCQVFLLELGFTEEQSFAILKHVCTDIVPLDYYINMVSLFSDKTMLVEMLRYFNRSLYNRIKSFDSDIISILAFPWFICLFTKSEIHRQITKVIWDYLLVDGFVVIFQAALVIMQLLQPAIQASNEFAEAVRACEEQIRKMKDPRPFIQGIKRININYRMLEYCRIGLNDKQQKQLLAPSSKYLVPKTIECKRQYHICLQEIENMKSQLNLGTTFVFKRKSKINMIPNYLQHIQTKYYSKNRSQISKQDFMMMSRGSHSCCGPEDEYDAQFDIGRLSIFKPQRHQGHKEEPKLKHLRFKESTSKLLKTNMIGKSQSMAFLEKMMQNQSFSNLLDLCEQEQDPESSDMDSMSPSTTSQQGHKVYKH